jgi:hypothetical protein
MIKSMKMRWAGNLVSMREHRSARKVLVEHPEGNRPLGRPDMDGKIILKRILQ